MFAILHLPSSLFQCSAQNALGKHPADKVLPAFFTGTNGTVNANAIIDGLNTRGTRPGTNTAVFGVGGTAGALTTNDARAVTFGSSLSVGGTLSAPTITGSVGSISAFSAVTLTASGAISGSGSGITALNGSAIASGTVADARIADAIARDSELVAADTVVSNGIVTSLDAGSYAVSEQALRGFLRFSSTNTAFLDGADVATNAITVVSNINTYASFVIPSQVSRGVNIGGTYYRKSYGVYTNGSIGAVFWDDPEINEDYTSLQFTNANYNTLDVDVLAVAYTTYEFLWFKTTTEILNHLALSFSPSLFPSAVNLKRMPIHAEFRGVHVGDGSALVNLPAQSGVLTNNWQSGAGVVSLTNKLRVKDIQSQDSTWGINFNYVSPHTNAFLLTNGTMQFLYDDIFETHYGKDHRFYFGGQSQSYWSGGDGGFLLRSKINIGIECPQDFGVIRLTDDHRVDGLVKLGTQSDSTANVWPSNNYSGMLAFQSATTNVAQGGVIMGYAGIRSKNAAQHEVWNYVGEKVTHAELWFYTCIPPADYNTNGGFKNFGDVNWFAIGRTNGLNVKNLIVSSNALSSWPTAPPERGAFAMVNSNGYPYMLLSTNGSGGSATWTGTNKIGW